MSVPPRWDLPPPPPPRGRGREEKREEEEKPTELGWAALSTSPTPPYEEEEGLRRRPKSHHTIPMRLRRMQWRRLGKKEVELVLQYVEEGGEKGEISFPFLRARV